MLFFSILDPRLKDKGARLRADCQVFPGGIAPVLSGIVVFAEQFCTVAVVNAEHGIHRVVYPAQEHADGPVCGQGHAVADALIGTDDALRLHFRAAGAERQLAAVDDFAQDELIQVLLGRFQQKVAVACEAFQGHRHGNARRDALRFNMDLLLGVQGAGDGEANANVIRHDEIIHSAAQAAGRIMADDRGAIVYG